MVTDRADGRALVDACRDAGVKLGVAFHMRWHAGHRALAEAARAGRFGTLRHMRILWTQRQPDASNWRAWPEVGRWWSLGGVGPHCVDQVCWFMQPEAGEVRTLRSVLDNSVFNSPHDETAVLVLHFENGATAEICTSMQFVSPKRMEVYGEKGWAVAEETFGYDGDGRIRTDRGEFDFPVQNPYVGEVRTSCSRSRRIASQRSTARRGSATSTSSCARSAPDRIRSGPRQAVAPPGRGRLPAHSTGHQPRGQEGHGHFMRSEPRPRMRTRGARRDGADPGLPPRVDPAA